jgi:hypothetical protein
VGLFFSICVLAIQEIRPRDRQDRQFGPIPVGYRVEVQNVPFPLRRIQTLDPQKTSIVLVIEQFFLDRAVAD